MKAIGKFVVVKPIEEHAEHVIFEIKRKIQKGILIDKGPDAFEDLPEGKTVEIGSTVYYFAGNHNEFDGYLLLHYTNLQGYEVQ